LTGINRRQRLGIYVAEVFGRAYEKGWDSYFLDKLSEHYHHERNHQGMINRLIMPSAPQTLSSACIVFRQRLGGLLKYYYRPAA
jgi:hypothetical protein